jgi:hypothetical protein
VDNSVIVSVYALVSFVGEEVNLSRSESYIGVKNIPFLVGILADSLARDVNHRRSGQKIPQKMLIHLYAGIIVLQKLCGKRAHCKG